MPVEIEDDDEDFRRTLAEIDARDDSAAVQCMEAELADRRELRRLFDLPSPDDGES